MRWDAHHLIDPQIALEPQGAHTGNTNRVGPAVDTQNASEVTLLFTIGNMALSGSLTVALIIEHRDTADDDWETVDSAKHLTGDTDKLTLPTDNSFNDTTIKVGYIGNKRYVRITADPSASISGTNYYSALWLLGRLQEGVA